MALIKCPECGKEISDKATACPNCGYPVEPNKQNETFNNDLTIPKKVKKKEGCLKPILIFFIICIGISAVIALQAPKKVSSPQSEPSTETTPETDDTKQAAKLTDEQIWEYVLPVINANNNLMKIVGNESATKLDIYNAAKDFKEFCRQTWSNPPEVSGNGAKEYLDSCRDYISLEQTMADSLLKYIDSGKTSDLSKAQENIQTCVQAISVVSANKGTFLSINGFTSEEIQEIINNSGIEE